MIRNKRLVFLLALALGVLFSGYLKAGNENQPVGARRIALGFAYTGVRGDFWQLFANPAGIAGMKQMQVGAFIERRFLLEQLNLGSLGFVMPFKNGKHFAGLDVSGFGFGGYAESRVGVAYATTLFERLSLGAKFNWARTSIANYGAKSALFVDAGVNMKISERISAGFWVFNANQAELLKDKDEKIPTSLDAGIAYQVSDKVLIVGDIQKQVNYPLSFRGGVEYAIIDILRARIGASTQPVTVSGGLGLEIKGLNVDFTSTLHQYLGYTPSFSLTYRFGQAPEKQ